MAELSTDIEALQAARDAVAERVSLTLRWRLALLLLLTVSLTAAWNGIRTGEAAAARKRIQALDPHGYWDGSRRLALYDLDPTADAGGPRRGSGVAGGANRERHPLEGGGVAHAETVTRGVCPG